VTSPATPSRFPPPAAAPAPEAHVGLLDRALAPLTPWLNRWHEHQQVARISREVLQLHSAAHAACPELRGRDLYAAILQLRQPGGPMSPEELLRRAAESYAAWPVERPLTLRDVVHYLAASELLTDHGSPVWTQGELRQLVGARIRADL
jgi:hypothetical protein